MHLRQPSSNKAENIKSGTKAALLGGYTLVCDMPNNPGNPTWSLAKVQEKQKIIKKSAYIPVAIYAGSQPDANNLEELAKMASQTIGLKIYGSPNVTNYKDYATKDFVPIIEKWHRVAPQKPIMFHRGSSNLDEMIELAAKKFKHQLHVCHVSQVSEVKAVLAAKKKGLRVTCGITPHHIFKTSYDAKTEGWFARMIPPLAHQDQTSALFDLFVDGSIDILETDHAPHLTSGKWIAEAENPEGTPGREHTTCFGVPGIEFALPLLFYQLQRGTITLERIVDATSKNPAKIIGIEPANSKVTWRMEQYRIGQEYPKGISGSGWTPYLDKVGVGRVQKVVLDGKVLVRDGKIIDHAPQAIAT